jgi:hypothetical protein
MLKKQHTYYSYFHHGLFVIYVMQVLDVIPMDTWQII